MSNFLPKDYKVPESSGGNYMKFEEGENLFRVLGSAVIGMEGWKARKPVRKQMGEAWQDGEADADPNTGMPRYKHFWAFPVWNYAAKKVQILEITQKGIMRAITSLVDDEAWGDPTGYDIKVTRTGKDIDTEYTVGPRPHTAPDQKVKEQYEVMNIKLDALFSGGDPFADTKEAPSNNDVDEDINPDDIPFWWKRPPLKLSLNAFCALAGPTLWPVGR